MKYQDYIKSYIGKAVRITENDDSGTYTITTRLYPKYPYMRDDILEVHDDFVVASSLSERKFRQRKINDL
jgi:hypothetical protein